MIRKVETNHYDITYSTMCDENNEPLLNEDGSILQEEIKTLKYTIEETFDDIEIISEEETIVNSILIETRRIMPNGDIYIIDGNNELYIPINPNPVYQSEYNKMWDVIEWVSKYGGLPNV